MPPELTPFSPMLVQVEVTFDALLIDSEEGPVSTNLSDQSLSIPQGFSMIVFRLKTINHPEGKRASFQTSPIQWFKPNDTTPVDTPGMFIVQRLGDDLVTILDFNSTPKPDRISHTFNVIVIYDGRTYSSDPTIVNEPPIG